MKAFSLSEYLLENEHSHSFPGKKITLVQSHDERALEENVILVYILINKKRVIKEGNWRLKSICDHRSFIWKEYSAMLKRVKEQCGL